ncbi:MAG: hypothetical protein HC906_02270 [Bacteroidales bacterium]|nr:hypothetical protein [Bacteroidales bacterium]
MIDQNGPDRKRFGSKRLEDFIGTICSYPVGKQKELLEAEIIGFMEKRNNAMISPFGITTKIAIFQKQLYV